MKEICCIGRFFAKEGCKERLHQEMLKLIAPTREEAGCIQYELTEEEPFDHAEGAQCDFCFVTRWRSREAFDIHCDMPYIKEFMGVTVTQYVEKMDIRLYSPAC
ncbi:MAG: putative quinol monooxygenase [Enterobacteriaceae bacterium]